MSKYHTHTNDGVFTNLAASETEKSVLGEQPSKHPRRQLSQTYFIEYSKQPKTHWLSNVGSTSLRVIDVKVLKGWPAPAPQNSSDK